jgi:DNA mismatch repair protein MutL
LLHMVACKAAIKAGQSLTPAEIDALLERRHLVSDSHHCPHGRPTALVFTRADLEKQFGRI